MKIAGSTFELNAKKLLWRTLVYRVNLTAIPLQNTTISNDSTDVCYPQIGSSFLERTFSYLRLHRAEDFVKYCYFNIFLLNQIASFGVLCTIFFLTKVTMPQLGACAASLETSIQVRTETNLQCLVPFKVPADMSDIDDIDLFEDDAWGL
mmetsp:Transcript_8094/g.9755  ORF Transcript_8094/g.9755 Transcript_8094/m.9755 type:complete len:150 (+) Transcript_8094:224-673(+)|eukprot:CAMPEP_0184032856 /NCGR_PEP_ID=MMETSP0955-20130417/3345_1 /TAXON_ID=627963 /ORGANISM="Aplanochytrium sp, Strain PBS07" /LENGTH=149 /DNA_ID=CAMNT_0026319053 /DNA_START=220 /DNA_END=669 /DNA_ORIENTATION=+